MHLWCTSHIITSDEGSPDVMLDALGSAEGSRRGRSRRLAKVETLVKSAALNVINGKPQSIAMLSLWVLSPQGVLGFCDVSSSLHKGCCRLPEEVSISSFSRTPKSAVAAKSTTWLIIECIDQCR